MPEIESIYRWKGKVNQGSEALLIVKTGEQLKGKVREEIERLHSYEMPAIEFIETELNSRACEWIEAETKG